MASWAAQKSTADRVLCSPDVEIIQAEHETIEKKLIAIRLFIPFY